MKSRSVIIILIVILLIVNAGTLALLLHGQKRSEDRKAAAQTARAVGDMSRLFAGIGSDALRDALAEKAKAEKEKTEKAAREDEARKDAAEHVFAHRGSSGEGLEHSFEAYDKAIEKGARYIEQDVVVSGDGTLFVQHDATAARMTGADRAFAGMSDEEIGKLRTRKGNPVLRLSQVFDRYGDSIVYVIELKSTDNATIQAFVDLVDQYRNEGQIIVQSLDPEVLRILDDVYPDMPKLLVCKTRADLERGLGASYADIISVRKDMMTEENAARVREKGQKFSAWTLLTEKEIRKAIDLGADSYFTDDVGLAMSIEEDYGYEKRNEGR